MEIKFRGLFKQVVEGEAYADAIITHYKSKTHLYEDGKHKIKHLLFIDLWLIQFVFNWESLQNIT
jgi:hypothetical protein